MIVAATACCLTRPTSSRHRQAPCGQRPRRRGHRRPQPHPGKRTALPPLPNATPTRCAWRTTQAPAPPRVLPAARPLICYEPLWQSDGPVLLVICQCLLLKQWCSSPGLPLQARAPEVHEADVVVDGRELLLRGGVPVVVAVPRHHDVRLAGQQVGQRVLEEHLVCGGASGKGVWNPC